jgi:hypothetical protein
VDSSEEAPAAVSLNCQGALAIMGTAGIIGRWRPGVLWSQVRIWVSGCCTGEEVYSIAIIMRESMDQNSSPKVVQA